MHFCFLVFGGGQIHLMSLEIVKNNHDVFVYLTCTILTKFKGKLILFYHVIGMVSVCSIYAHGSLQICAVILNTVIHKTLSI